jgi:redox-sensing transcriptional repressor
MNRDISFSNPVLKRLPIYYRCLSNLMKIGINRISSRDLGNMMGITSSQVRQDFANFGGNGLQGYGYDVEFLKREIYNILGLNEVQNIIVIGVGNLGQALAKYVNFEKNGFKLVGLYDSNPQLIGKKIDENEIRPFDSLGEFLKDNHVDIAVITVPENHASEVAWVVANMGIKALWNFAPVELKVPQGVVVENIHLVDSLIVLGYKLRELGKE